MRKTHTLNKSTILTLKKASALFCQAGLETLTGAFLWTCFTSPAIQMKDMVVFV